MHWKQDRFLLEFESLPVDGQYLPDAGQVETGVSGSESVLSELLL